MSAETRGVTADSAGKFPRVINRNGPTGPWSKVGVPAHCAKCAREFGDAEPVYRRRLTPPLMCGKCAAEDSTYVVTNFDGRLLTVVLYKWSHPTACPCCGRLVCFARAKRARPLPEKHRRFCCDLCAIRAANARRRLIRRECRLTRCHCCKKWFTGARDDAKFCSAACRQRAYRQRRCEPA